MIENKIVLKPLDEVIAAHESRQRETAPRLDKVKDLAQDIIKNSLIHAIVANKDDDKLIVGAHRLEAFRFLRDNKVECPWASYKNWTVIPLRYATNCTEADIQAIELVENIKRTDLTWREEALAVAKFHAIQKESDSEWHGSDTASALGLPSSGVSQRLQVALELQAGNKKINECATMSAAVNIINRQNERAIAAEMELMESLSESSTTIEFNPATKISEDESKELSEAEVHVEVKTSKTAFVPAAKSIFNVDFVSWLESFSGPKFNFMHCDFPYGIEHQKSEQGGSAKWDAYDDSEEVYWKLLQALADHRNKILTHSCHIMFWYSLEFDAATRAFFSEQMPDFTVQTFPMIWHKTDNKGLLPDSNRYGRRTYETAMLLTRGDRKIVSPVALSYGAPTGTKEHLSMKPEPMLRHFFRMFVDEYTRMLDPTCGSATALRAGESLNAEHVLGLELSEENFESACVELNKFRKLRLLEA
jgi:DNA modification methylase